MCIILFLLYYIIICIIIMHYVERGLDEKQY